MSQECESARPMADLHAGIAKLPDIVCGAHGRVLRDPVADGFQFRFGSIR